MKIATIVGARPQFIKASVVSRALKKKPKIQEIIIHTGQHYDINMSQVFFEELKLAEPAYNLNIKQNLHGAMTADMLSGVETVLIKEKPDLVIVYGDTNSTLAGALAAIKLEICVAHVEAGLRSYNRKMPEEINRILTDQISSFLFCTSEKAVDTLKAEGYKAPTHKIYNTGDVMYDAALYYSSISNAKRPPYLTDYILCTIHRAENTDNANRLRQITAALNEVNKKIKVIVPLHPRTTAVLKKENIQTDFSIIEPLSYLQMQQLLQYCSLVITDSGGLQKEAYYFKKFCIILRNETEWTELTENHFSIIAGTDTDKIKSLALQNAGRQLNSLVQLYGDGNAGRKIADIIERQF